MMPLIPGLALALCASLLARGLAALPWNSVLQLSSLTLAIVCGMVLGNTSMRAGDARLDPGLRCSQQALLRLGIVLYGVRLSLHDIARVGLPAILLDATMTSLIILTGLWVGVRWLKLDRETALLTAAGSGICGAAAVLATERVIDAKAQSTSVAVATVVVFGTIAMFAYPMLYPLTGFSQATFGVYTGATVHEVAQVVAAGRAVGEAAADTAVVTKMLRVLLLIPFLMLVANRYTGTVAGTSGRMHVPWFALLFGAVILINSIVSLPDTLRTILIELDTLLLGAAMFALGLNTRWQQVRAVGWRPMALAGLLFALLSAGGYVLTRCIVA